MSGDRSKAAGKAGGQETSGAETKRTSDRQVMVAEWTTLAISTVILLAIVGAITWLSFNGEERPPVIAVEADLERLREEENGYYLPVTIRNDGDRTVEDVIVQGELVVSESEPETVDITISFLAGGESVEGVMVFRSDPAQGDLTTGATSYKEP
jgi:uncharacterized protein (TIGR02588 family)